MFISEELIFMGLGKVEIHKCILANADELGLSHENLINKFLGKNNEHTTSEENRVN